MLKYFILYVFINGIAQMSEKQLVDEYALLKLFQITPSKQYTHKYIAVTNTPILLNSGKMSLFYHK